LRFKGMKIPLLEWSVAGLPTAPSARSPVR
jgi:hypothetical protein